MVQVVDPPSIGTQPRVHGGRFGDHGPVDHEREVSSMEALPVQGGLVRQTPIGGDLQTAGHDPGKRGSGLVVEDHAFASMNTCDDSTGICRSWLPTFATGSQNASKLGPAVPLTTGITRPSADLANQKTRFPSRAEANPMTSFETSYTGSSENRRGGRSAVSA